MNLLKKFIRPEPDYDGDIYGEDEGIGFDFPPDIEEELNKKNLAESVAAIDNPARKNPEIHTASPEKVALKLMQPRSIARARSTENSFFIVFFSFVLFIFGHSRALCVTII